MKTQEESFIRIDKEGDKYYFKDKAMTILHRLDGPAVEYAAGHKFWFLDGKRHRLDGPASEYSDGSKSWWVDGKYLTEEAFISFTAPKPVELTLDQIAAKFGISVEQLKVVK